MDRYQLAAARGMLGWTLKELSEKTNITIEAINKFERGEVDSPRKSTIQAIRQAFEGEGIEFIDQSGVRKRDDTFQIFTGNDPYLQLLDFIFMKLKNSGQEILFSYIDNSKSPPEILDSDIRMRRNGLKFRCLTEEANNYCVFPLEEYRWVPKQYFNNNTQVVFLDYVATMINGNEKCFIIKNESYAATMRNAFNYIWIMGKMPNHSTAPKVYE